MLIVAMTEGRRWTDRQKRLVTVPLVIALFAVRRLLGEQWDVLLAILLGVLAVVVVIRDPDNMRMFVLSVAVALAACGFAILGIVALG